MLNFIRQMPKKGATGQRTTKERQEMRWAGKDQPGARGCISFIGGGEWALPTDTRSSGDVRVERKHKKMLLVQQQQ